MNFHPFFVCAPQKSALRAVHPSEQLPHARLGVVVAKRFAPRASPATRSSASRASCSADRPAAIDCVVRLASRSTARMDLPPLQS
jgi:ribonuclease P protein component